MRYATCKTYSHDGAGVASGFADPSSGSQHEDDHSARRNAGPCGQDEPGHGGGVHAAGCRRFALVIAVVAAACSSSSSDTNETMPDASSDAPVADVSSDAPVAEASSDAPVADASSDAGDGGGTPDCTGCQATTAKYQETDDLDAACADEFGTGYRLADWNEIKAIPAADIADWADSVGMTETGYTGMLVSRDEVEFHAGSNRHYFIERHDHTVPNNWLAHDDIDDHFIDLGSWYGLTIRVLCHAP